MEKQMNYILKLNTFMSSLEHRALIKTTIALWNAGDIPLDDIEWEDEKWIAEDHVIGKVKELPLPESLKKKISGFIKPIGYEILKWINHYQNILSNSKIEARYRKSLEDIKKVGKSLSKLCWTPQGTVDREKTVEELIRDETLDITERYKLACVYCLRNDILKLWNKMPEYCRKSFYSEEDSTLLEHWHDLVVFWTNDIQGERTRMNNLFKGYWTEPHTPNPNKFACDSAFDCHNKVATEYFWQYLPSEERQGYLDSMDILIFNEWPKDDIVDLLFFFLSQMDEELKMDVLKEFPSKLLLCLLDWPCQDFFMETVDLVWGFLSGDDYFFLLDSIINKVKNGYQDYDYKKLFRKFWQQSLITHKKYVTDEWVHEGLDNNLLEIEDKDFFKIIFASTSDREKLLLSDDGNYLCERLILYNEMDSLKALVRECLSSKDVIIKFREEFKNHVFHHHSNIKKTQEEKEDEFSEFFQLLDELILEDDNRKRVDEGNTDPAAKRLCTHNK